LSNFISENQKDWISWIPMYFLACCSSKHEASDSPAELYFACDLHLSVDLLRRSPPNRGMWIWKDYTQRLREKLNAIHCDARQCLNLQSPMIKGLNKLVLTKDDI